MTADFAALLWPSARIADALAALARESGFTTGNQKLEAGNVDLEFAARSLDLEARPIETSYADFERLLPKLAPVLLRAPGIEGESFLAILPDSVVLSPDLQKVRMPPASIRSLLCGGKEAVLAQQAQEALQRAQVPAGRQSRAREAILREQLGRTAIRGIWLLRTAPGANFWRQLREARVPQRLAVLAGAHATQYVLWILSWWVVGSSVLSGRADRNWLWRWSLLLLALIPLRVLITWLQGRIAIGAGAKLKQRMFFGALRMEPDSLRHQGAGQLLGRVLESESVEALALSGGFLGSVAIIELLAASLVLAAGAGGLVHSLLLLAWLAFTGILARRYFTRNRAWTDERLAMTHDLVESMVGHRTRLAQLPSEQWHTGEDEALAQYLDSSRHMDRSTTALLAIVPRGWLVLGLLGLAPAFVAGASSIGRLAVAVGGMLLAYRALKRLGAGAWQLAGAAVAWQRVSILYRSAMRPEALGLGRVTPGADSPVVEARDLAYRYHDRQQPVLRDCSLRIRAGDRVVLEGPSGGGKSTLVSLLAGLRAPNAGQVLVDGFGFQDLGAVRWRQRIAVAPQFHENYVLTDTFAFNLLMGRPGVPGPADLQEAEDVCQELGLGGLLARMPAGMLQMVGETGWQLSHGERSRLYIARALLQGAEVVVLDESFAALDPENLKRVMECVARRAPSLLVIAHR